MQPVCVMATFLPARPTMPAHSTHPAHPWTMPPGLRAPRATRALAALYQAQPQAALSEAEVEAALDAAGVAVNRVTVYRMLDRFAAAGVLHRQIDRSEEHTS